MSRLSTIERHIRKDRGMATNRDRVLNCMSFVFCGQEADCVLKNVVYICENCPSDSKSNLVKVVECLDLKQ